MPQRVQSYVHLHLVSDSTGETLIAVARAVAVQYASVRAIEHIYPLVRGATQLDRVIAEIEAAPGIVLYTLVNNELSERIEVRCAELGVPCVSVLAPVSDVFRNYLGTESTPTIGGQHVLNSDYFRRIDALNYSMAHDDGQMTGDIEEADVVIVGISRTSKTPTSIYLANRGIKTANVPLVPNIPLPEPVLTARKPLVVALVATPERIVQIRQNRLLAFRGDARSSYVDRAAVAEEVATTRRLCAKQGWPMIDVTRRSIEETAAAIVALLQERKSA